MTETLAQRVERWMETEQRVELACATGHGCHGRGRVIGYSDEPVAIVRLDDGTDRAWVAHLIRETDRPAPEQLTRDEQASVVAESVDLRNPDWRADLARDIAAVLAGAQIKPLPDDHPLAVAAAALPGDREYTPTPAVVLPTRWSVAVQDGTTPYLDEPDALVAAGTYLVGRTDSDDPETAWTVCLRAEYAVDADGQIGVSTRDVVQAIADRLNDRSTR